MLEGADIVMKSNEMDAFVNTGRLRGSNLPEVPLQFPAGSGLGPWYLARAKALSVGLSNVYFKSPGLPTLIDEC